jgi:hypothetical protein
MVRIVSNLSNSQAGVPTLVSCPRLLAQYIRNNPSYLQAVTPSETRGTPCCDRTHRVVSLIIPNTRSSSFAPCFRLACWPLIIVIIISIIIKFANLCNHVVKGKGDPVTWNWRHRGAGYGWVVNAKRHSLYPREGDQHQLNGCGKSRPHGDRTPNRPTRILSLYRLNYAIPQPWM